MNKKYILKGLLLLLLFPATIYYFLNSVGNEVSLSSFFIIILTIMNLNEEFTSTIKRTIYQELIDWSLVIILILLSLDVIFSLIINGLAL